MRQCDIPRVCSSPRTWINEQGRGAARPGNLDISEKLSTPYGSFEPSFDWLKKMLKYGTRRNRCKIMIPVPVTVLVRAPVYRYCTVCAKCTGRPCHGLPLLSLFLQALLEIYPVGTDSKITVTVINEEAARHS